VNSDRYRLVRTISNQALEAILSFFEAWEPGRGDVPLALDLLGAEREARIDELAVARQVADRSFVEAVIDRVMVGEPAAAPPGDVIPFDPRLCPGETHRSGAGCDCIDIPVVRKSPAEPPGPKPAQSAPPAPSEFGAVAGPKRCDECGTPGARLCHRCRFKRGRQAKAAKAAKKKAPKEQAADAEGESRSLVTRQGTCRKCRKGFEYTTGARTQGERTICPPCDGQVRCVHCARWTRGSGGICPTCRAHGKTKLDSAIGRLLAEPVPVIAEEYVTGDGSGGLERGRTYKVTRLAPAGWRDGQDAVDQLDGEPDVDVEVEGLGGRKL
jgi:hypothetical protein